MDNTPTKPPSTYTESHKRYYQRYKPLIHARRRKYSLAAKKKYYYAHRDEILAARAIKRALEKEKRLQQLAEYEKYILSRSESEK